jgi:hypothetical protein
MAKQAGAAITEADGSQVVMISQPQAVTDVILEALAATWAAMGMAVDYPIALDSDYLIWDAFANRYWPAAYRADWEGRIRHHQFGEGGYEEVRTDHPAAPARGGHKNIGDDLVSVVPGGFEAQADWTSLGSPERNTWHRHVGLPAVAAGAGAGLLLAPPQ